MQSPEVEDNENRMRLHKSFSGRNKTSKEQIIVSGKLPDATLLPWQ